MNVAVTDEALAALRGLSLKARLMFAARLLIDGSPYIAAALIADFSIDDATLAGTEMRDAGLVLELGLEEGETLQ